MLTHNNHTSWRHIWRLAWPIIISNVTVPLVGAVDVAMMGRIDDPAFIGGVGLGMMLFNAIYFGMGFCAWVPPVLWPNHKVTMPLHRLAELWCVGWF